MSKNHNYIKPPKSEDCIWRSGPPPEIGWWPASSIRRMDGRRAPQPEWLRYWDGKAWSVGDFAFQTAEVAAEDAGVREPVQYNIFWTDRWWETKR